MPGTAAGRLKAFGGAGKAIGRTTGAITGAVRGRFSVAVPRRCGSTIPPGEQSLAAQRTRVAGQVSWQRFDESKIADLVADGKVVFIDITAEWCLTCKANKLFSLSDAEVVSALTENGVVAMQGDFTKPDKVIEKFLRKHNRYGIPFNIVYGPSHPEGLVLPELLTPAIALEALESAKK